MPIQRLSKLSLAAALTALLTVLPSVFAGVNAVWSLSAAVERNFQEQRLLRRDLDTAKAAGQESRASLQRIMDDRDRQIEARLSDAERRQAATDTILAETRADLRHITALLAEVRGLVIDLRSAQPPRR